MQETNTIDPTDLPVGTPLPDTATETPPAPRRRKKLTDEEKALIITMWHEGSTKYDIAKAIDASVFTVRSHFRRYRHLFKKRYPRVAPDKLVELAELAGLSPEGFRALQLLAKPLDLRTYDELKKVCEAYAVAGHECYYTGVPLQLNAENSLNRLIILNTEDGFCFASELVADMRGAASNKSFLKLIHTIAKRCPI